MSILEDRVCPICESKKSEALYRQEFSNVLGVSLDVFEQNIVICKDCGMVYTSPFFIDEDINSYYSSMSAYEYDENNNEFPDEDKNKSLNQFNYIKSFIGDSNKLSVLDIGCALGYTLSLFKKNGYKVLGLDPSLKNKIVAKENYDVDVETRFLDKGGLEGRRFDVVILSHVAEHLKHPMDIFNCIRDVLSENGILYIETPDIDLFDEQDLFQFSFEHINYFNIESTKSLLQKAGFELLHSNIFYNDQETAPFYPTLGTLWKKSSKKSLRKNLYQKNKTTIQNYIDKVNCSKNGAVSKIEQILKDHNSIAIWSAGTLTSQLLSKTSLSKDNVKCIFDNDTKKDGLKMNEIFIYKPILSSDYFKGKDINAIIIVSWSSQREIYSSISFLEEHGIKIYKLF